MSIRRNSAIYFLLEHLTKLSRLMEAAKVRKNKAEENQFVAQISNDARNYFYIVVRDDNEGKFIEIWHSSIWYENCFSDWQQIMNFNPRHKFWFFFIGAFHLVVSSHSLLLFCFCILLFFDAIKNFFELLLFYPQSLQHLWRWIDAKKERILHNFHFFFYLTTKSLKLFSPQYLCAFRCCLMFLFFMSNRNVVSFTALTARINWSKWI